MEWIEANAGWLWLVLAAGLLTIAAPWLMQVPALHGVLVALGCVPPGYS